MIKVSLVTQGAVVKDITAKNLAQALKYKQFYAEQLQIPAKELSIIYKS